MPRPAMTLLVLSVDRDNDFGVKAGIQSPVIGRDANVKAALALGLADPEDSDTNSVLGAVKIFDEAIAKGREAEIVTICGSQKVGPHSDQIIAEQLDEVLAKLKVDRCVFVTDGAEDEFILPLVTSRVRVEAVQRVIVRQHHDIEGTYYIVRKAFEDEKLRRSILIPAALALIVYGVFAWYGRPAQGLGALATLVGLYFMAKIVRVGDVVREVLGGFTSALATGRFTLFTAVLGGLLVVAGVINTVQALPPDPNLLAYTLAFASAMLWWLLGAALVHVAGRVLDTYIREPGRVWEYWVMPFSLVALGLLLSPTLAAIGRAIGGEAFGFTAAEFVGLATGLVIAFVGVGSNAFVKSALAKRDQGRAPGAREGPAKAP